MKKIVHPLIITVSILILTYTLGIGIKNVFRYNRFKIEHAHILRKLDLETQKNHDLAIKLKALQEKSFWEITAKKHLGFVNKKEIVYKTKPKSK